jgi:hypothetical protein
MGGGRRGWRLRCGFRRRAAAAAEAHYKDQDQEDHDQYRQHDRQYVAGRRNLRLIGAGGGAWAGGDGQQIHNQAHVSG